MVVAVLGNSLVLAAIIRTPSIRSTAMIMLCSLAVSDRLVGLIALPLYMATYLTEDHFVHHVAHTIGFSLCGVSLLTITTISVDRFLALHYHMRYATLVTESRVRYTIMMIWLTGFGLSSSEHDCSLRGSCSCYHLLPYNFHIFLHYNLSNCSPSSITDSRSSATNAKFQHRK